MVGNDERGGARGSFSIIVEKKRKEKLMRARGREGGTREGVFMVYGLSYVHVHVLVQLYGGLRREGED